MGYRLSKPVEEQFKKNQEFMLQLQKLQIERQIHVQNQMRERMAAMQIARSRELLYWLGSFYVLATIGLIVGYRKTKRTRTLIPIFPLTYIVAYQADLAYGNKLIRIQGEAENILQFENELVELPRGIPSFQTIEKAREHMHEEDNLKKAHDIFL
ncbi:plasminogen receptor (KT)-like [Centruroides sculpturatus]|uniref:plasminogen receptor (KT)-like n=1 Tax=Centruroides sculpturatus TaxID=218467 RepID=UPI000C6D80D5|nr:plasminogen receptor (KT)-like [Centruroides sculpturatus]